MNKILVTGSNGQLGREFKKLENYYPEFIFIFKDINLDITNKNQVERFVRNNSVKTILNTAAYTNVNKAEIEKNKANQVNNIGVKNLVELCEKYDLKLIHFSTDYVYSSKTIDPIDENKITNPLNYYGISKRNGELCVENSNSESIIIRTSWLYSKYGNNFVKSIIEKGRKENEIFVVNDQYGSPTYAKDLALDTLRILCSNIQLDFNGKIYNYSNLGSTNWSKFASKIIEILDLDCKINEVNTSFFSSTVKRPKYSITNKDKIMKTFNLNIPRWEDSLEKFLKNFEK
jgi:dTDP-4-dehydrorhamnose reductase